MVHLWLFVSPRDHRVLNHLENLRQLNQKGGLKFGRQTVFKLFLWSYLDHRGIFSDQKFCERITVKTQIIQHLTWQRHEREPQKKKLYQKLDLESLQQWQWYKKLCFFFNIMNNQSPKYHFKLIETAKRAEMTSLEVFPFLQL